LRTVYFGKRLNTNGHNANLHKKKILNSTFFKRLNTKKLNKAFCVSQLLNKGIVL
jgi:hypothetical protein